MKQSLEKLSNDEVRVRCIHGAVGAINESDVMLASVSGAIIIGFNVRMDNAVRDVACLLYTSRRMLASNVTWQWTLETMFLKLTA